MNAFRFANFLVLALILSLPVVGCRKHPVDVTKLPGGYTRNPNEAGPAGMDQGETLGGGTGIESQPMASREEFENMLKDPSAFAADTVYFDFDSSVVRSSEMSKVADVAAALKANPSNKLLIEGYCDERGTEEYNRALGERRALALRDALIQEGVSGDRIRTISYGEDRPADPNHDEIAWAKNRRGEFILLLPK